MRKGDILIISAGMARSASTWMYNAIRLLLDAHPDIAGNLGCGWLGDWNSIPKRKYRLIKMHEYDIVAVDLSRAVFYSYRDIRDAIASQQRKFGGTPNMSWADAYVQLHEQWMQKADFSMRYETMLQDQEGIIAGIAEVIGSGRAVPPFPPNIMPEPARIVAELQRLNYEADGEKNGRYHKINLYHRDHITDGRIGSWQGSLDGQLASRITEKYRWWFDKYGYTTELAPRAGLEPATR
jgi:hypothetical protein